MSAGEGGGGMGKRGKRGEEGRARERERDEIVPSSNCNISWARHCLLLIMPVYSTVHTHVGCRPMDTCILVTVTFILICSNYIFLEVIFEPALHPIILPGST